MPPFHLVFFCIFSITQKYRHVKHGGILVLYLVLYETILFIHTVVRSLFGDVDVMRMALFQGCRGNLYETSGFL